MKILHCSDIHLGKRPLGSKKYSNSRYNDFFVSFENIVDFAMENRIDIFLIAGDFFDRKELFPEILLRTETILQKLRDNNITVLIIEGNHDKIFRDKENESWLKYLEKRELLEILQTQLIDGEYRFIPKEIDGIKFYGLGYFGLLTDDIIEKLSQNLEGDNNIVLVHTALSGSSDSNFFPGTVQSQSLNKILDKVLYIAGGHFHHYSVYPKENPKFFVPGSPEYWDLNENGKRGFIVFDTNTKKHTFVDSKKREKLDISIEIESLNGVEFWEEFSQKIDKLDLNDGILLNLKLILKNSFIVDINRCQEFLEDKGVLKAQIKIVYKLRNQKVVELDNKSFNIEEIEKEAIESFDEFANYSTQIAKSLQNLKENFYNSNETLFYDNYTEIIDSILDNEVK